MNHALQHKPFRVLSEVQSFGQAIARCRIARNLSYREVADRVGVSTATVRDWEMGLAVPDRPKLARLINMCFRQLQYFTYLLPQELRERPRVEPKNPEEAFTPEQFKGPIPDDLKPPKQPKTFAEAVKQAREEEGLSRKELAEVIGVTENAVMWWENGSNVPFLGNYQKLVELLPLVATVPKPQNMRTYDARPQPKPVEMPKPPPPQPQVKTSVEELGAAYAKSLAEVEAAKKALADLEKTIDVARQLVGFREQQAEKAKAAMLAAVSGK